MTRIYPFQRTARWLSLGFLAAALLLGSWTLASASGVASPQSGGQAQQDNVDPRRSGQQKVSQQAPEKDEPPAALSPHHAMLFKLEGDWTVRARIYEAPDVDPVEMHGAVRNEVILDGRALKTEFKGTLMGRPVAGLGLDGYDLQEERHFSIWMDSMNTGVAHDHGDCSHEDRDVVNLQGEFRDAETGETVRKRTRLQLNSSSQYTYEEWQVRGDAEERLAMRIIFSRTK